MVDVASLFRKLIGGSEPPATVTLAPPLSAYPSQSDAEYAQDYGFGYGTPNESYIQGNAARVMGQPKGKLQAFVPGTAKGLELEDAVTAANSDKTSQNLDLTDPANEPMRKSLGTTLTQAALAANRIPVAALGFDPDRMGFDTVIKNPNVGGIYSPTSDAIYSNLNQKDPSTPVHESIHRGLEILRKDPKLADVFKALPDEEMLVRYLMATQAGDPEKGIGNASDRERAAALKILGSGHYTQSLSRLEKAAQDAYAARRPRGPR